MEAKVDISYPLNYTSREEIRNGTFEVRWVVEEDGMANGMDTHGYHWEAMWTGDTLVGVRRA